MNKEMTDEEFYSIQDIEELVDMCLTKDHNLKILQSQLDIANKKIEEIKKYLGSNEFFEGTHFDTNYDDDIVKFNEEVDRVIKKILSIIGGE